MDRVRRKIILIQPSDKALYLSGLRERGVPGYVYIFAHARSNSLQGVTRQDVIADLIHRSGIWHGQPIMIDACNAGAEPDGIASSLALALRTFVTGSDNDHLELRRGRLGDRSGRFREAAGRTGWTAFSGSVPSRALAYLGTGWEADCYHSDLSA